MGSIGESKVELKIFCNYCFLLFEVFSDMILMSVDCVLHRLESSSAAYAFVILLVLESSYLAFDIKAKEDGWRARCNKVSSSRSTAFHLCPTPLADPLLHFQKLEMWEISVAGL